jgi:hypothetical protein
MTEKDMIQYLRTINGVLTDTQLTPYRRAAIVISMNRDMIHKIKVNL